MTEGNGMKKNNPSSAFDFIKSSFLYQQWEGAGFLLFACAQDRSVSDYPVAGATTSSFSSCSKRTYYCPQGEEPSSLLSHDNDDDDGVLIVWDKVVCSQQQQQLSRRQRDRMYLRKQSILQRHDSDIFRDELPSSQSSIDTCTTATMQTTSFDDEEEEEFENDDDRNDHNDDDDHPRREDDRTSSIFRTRKNQRSTNPLTLGTSLGFYKSPALAFDDDEEDDDNSIIIYEDEP